MALDTSAENLWTERTEAVRFRHLHTKLAEERIKQYHGSTYRDGSGPDVESYENQAFDLMVNLIPHLVYYNPSVQVKSSRPVVQRKLANSMEHGLNRWVRDIAYADVLTEVALDLLFSFGVCLTHLEPVPGYEDRQAPPLRPALTRLDPTLYFCDPQSKGRSQIRYEGHDCIEDRDDMLEATITDPETGEEIPKFYRAKVKLLATDVEGLDSPSNFYDRGRLPGGVTKVPRNQIRYSEIWVPETGKIYTVASQTVRGKEESHFIAKPREFFGPPWGCYTLFGVYAVPSQVYPLPPLAITDNLVDEINAQIDQVTDQADKARQILVVNATNNKAVTAIKNARNGEILAIPGFDATQTARVQLDGPSPEQMNYIETLRARLDRKSGTPEFQRGNVTGDATAAENNLAAVATDSRRKFMKSQFGKSAIVPLKTAAWYMAKSNNVAFNVPVPASLLAEGEEAEGMIGGNTDEMVDGVFLGGPQDGEDFDFNDLEVEIKPYSMELVDEAQIRRDMQNTFALVIQTAPMIPQMPWVNWKSLFDDMFEAINAKDGRKYFDWDMLAQMMQQMAQPGAPLEIAGVDGQPGVNPLSLLVPKQGLRLPAGRSGAGRAAPGRAGGFGMPRPMSSGADGLGSRMPAMA